MSGGGKGGTSETKVKLPKELSEASKDAISLAKDVGRIGFMPFSGPAVAAFTPQQEAAFTGASQASSAFGLGGSAFAKGFGLPNVQTTPDGVRGYSAMPMYDAAVANIPPGQLEALRALFINPQTGAAPAGATRPQPQQAAPQAPAGPTKGGFGEVIQPQASSNRWWM